LSTKSYVCNVIIYSHTMLKTTVKVGEISNLSDARYCAGMGVEMLGFLLDTDEAISVTDIREITDWIEGCTYVAEFKSSSLEEIEQKIQDFPFDYIQIQDKSILPHLQKKGMKVILECEVKDIEEEIDVAYVLIKGTLSDDFSIKYPVLLGGDINKEQLEHIVDAGVGINLLGSKEIRPGYKDFDELADILEGLELDE